MQPSCTMLEAVNSDQQIERGAITHFACQCSLGRPTVPPLDFSRISNVFLESGWHWYVPGVSISLAAVFLWQVTMTWKWEMRQPGGLLVAKHCDLGQDVFQSSDLERLRRCSNTPPKSIIHRDQCHCFSPCHSLSVLIVHWRSSGWMSSVSCSWVIL